MLFDDLAQDAAQASSSTLWLMPPSRSQRGGTELTRYVLCARLPALQPYTPDRVSVGLESVVDAPG